jgi:aspartate aminotransferase-like enzyme
MKKTGVDAIVSAPQKGWTGPACCGLVMLSKRAEDRIHDDKAQPSSNSFCCNLAKWLNVMESYEDGKAKYYTTLPTDSLMAWSNVLSETRDFGFDLSKSRIFELGGKIRKVLEENGFSSVADDSCKAPGVVVSYSPYEGMYAKFKEQGLQVAGGVPFKLGEKVDPPKQCFRIGLFGLDKNKNVDRTVATFEKALKKIVAAEKKQ